MRLIDLEPEFVRFLPELVCPSMHKREFVTALAEAQGIRFTHPVCPERKVCVPFSGRGAPSDENNGIQWSVSGTSFADLTLSPSINSRDWHGYITNGQVTSC